MWYPQIWGLINVGHLHNCFSNRAKQKWVTAEDALACSQVRLDSLCLAVPPWWPLYGCGLRCSEGGESTTLRENSSWRFQPCSERGWVKKTQLGMVGRNVAVHTFSYGFQRVFIGFSSFELHPSCIHFLQPWEAWRTWIPSWRCWRPTTSSPTKRRDARPKIFGSMVPRSMNRAKLHSYHSPITTTRGSWGATGLSIPSK